jgi:hypothetical protein
MVVLQLLALPLLVAACLVFFGLAVLLGRQPFQIKFTAWEVVATLVGVVLIMVLHELVHGVTMRVFGARPQYGFLLKEAMLYATAPGFAFRRDQYLAIALAPLVSLSLLQRWPAPAGRHALGAAAGGERRHQRGRSRWRPVDQPGRLALPKRVICDG